MSLFEDVENQIINCFQSSQGVQIKLSDGREFNLAVGFTLNKKTIQGWDKQKQREIEEIPLTMIVEAKVS